MCMGLCLAISALMKRGVLDLVSVETLTPPMESQVTFTASIAEPVHTPTDTSTPSPEVSTPVAPTATPIPSATATLPPLPTGAPSPTGPGVTASSTSTPSPGPYLFAVGHNATDCRGGQGYIRGVVTDSDGNGLAGVRVRLYNDYGFSPEPQPSKGAPEAGRYEYAMGSDAGLFHVVIVDSVGQPISLVEDVTYEPGCIYYVDWQEAR
jgi:hypothetical protein